jgi:hypothetical protein
MRLKISLFRHSCSINATLHTLGDKEEGVINDAFMEIYRLMIDAPVIVNPSVFEFINP